MCRSKISFLGSVIFMVLLTSPSLFALNQTPKPVAIRYWGQSMVSIETYWNLKVVIDPFGLKIGYDDPGIDADLLLITHEHFDHNNISMVKGNPQLVKGLDDHGKVVLQNLIFERKANQATASLSQFDDTQNYSEHAIQIQTIASHHDTQQGKERGHNAMFLIQTNGLRILHAGDLGQRELTDAQLNQIGRLDVLLIPVGGVYTIDAPQAVEIIRQLEPRCVLPVHYKTEQLKIDLHTIDPFLKVCPKKYQRVEAIGNTVAILQNPDSTFEKQQLVLLKTQPWKMPNELAELFDKKEASAQSVKADYARLSINQLNHKPSNGTHTPRWNVEHIMARELGFFSSIYSHLTPMILPIDLNPAQTPPEYQAAHPDWTGEEEARQLQRTQAFSRRFAYLLNNIELTETPKGISWPLNELLTRMIDHYPHHTDNLPAKTKLPDWPPK